MKTLEAEGGRQRRIEENRVSVPPSWHLTISLRRATLALAIATPYGRGDAGAPCPHTGPFFCVPFSLRFTGSAPGSYSYYIRSQYTAVEQEFTTSKMSALLSEVVKTNFSSVMRGGYRCFSTVVSNSEKQ